jgi:hypothetical protein
VQLVELQENFSKIRKQGLGLAAISYDSVEALRTFARRTKITYPLLSDPDSKVIRAYGLLNESVKPDTAQYGIPHPVTLVLDRQGIVRSRYFEDDYRRRVTASDILVRDFGEKPGARGQTTETRHLRLESGASIGTVHYGQRIALVLDIDLKPKMHVYAPGVEGYIPVEWRLFDSPAFTAHPIEYPPSKELHLKAIDERAPVYEGRMRLIQEITLAEESRVKPLLDSQGNLVIEGIFRYQACDDRVCYLPQSVPLTWRLRYEALDRERVPEELRRKAPAGR